MTGTTVYVLSDIHGRVLYVGISDRTLGRMSDHQRSKAWWTSVADARFTHFSSRGEAEATERTLIRVLRPPHNIAGQPTSPVAPAPPPRIEWWCATHDCAADDCPICLDDPADGGSPCHTFELPAGKVSG